MVAACHAQGDRARMIKSSVAGHSPLMDRFEAPLGDELGVISPEASSVTIYSTVTGGPIDPAELGTPHWFRNLREPVRFATAMRRLIEHRPESAIVELSSHPLLVLAAEEIADTLAASPAVVGTLHRDDGGVGRVLASLAALHTRGVPVDWEAAFAADRPSRVALPTYAFQRRRYWLDAPGSTDTAPAEVPAVDADSIHAFVYAETAALLAVSGSDLTAVDLAVRSTETFKDLGFDSSAAVGLRNRLTAATGVRLPATVAFTYPTPDALGRHLHSLLEPQRADTGQAAADPGGPSDEELYELVDRGYA